MSGKISWIVAILLLLVFAGFMAMRLFIPRADGPTLATTKTGVLDKIEPDMPVTDIVGIATDNDDAAGAYYTEAIEFFKSKESEYKEIDTIFNEATTPPQLYGWQLEICEELRQKMKPARNCGKMQYIFVETPQEIKLSATTAGQTDLYWLKNMLQHLCRHYQETQEWEKAIEAAKEMLVLGWQMCNDDSRINMQIIGLDFQGEAAQRMAEYYKELKKPEMAKRCNEYYQKVMKAERAANQKFNAVWNLRKRKGGKQGPHPGDLQNIIKNDKSRAWKVDALLAMSIAKLQEIHHEGNTNMITEILAEYSNNKDPLLAKAAQRADKATKDDVQAALQGK